MDLQLKDKVVIVTGGARGIGEGITRAFAAEGAVVAIFGRNPDDAAKVVGQLAAKGQRAESHPVEMTDEAAVKKAVATVVKRHGRIDIVVNNAGGNDAVSLRHPIEAFRASLENNIVQCFSLVHHALDHLIAARGCVINIGSKCAATGQGGTSGYAASKGAMNALTREWALDLGRHGVRVNCVIPAEVITPLYERWLAQAPDPEAARAQLEQTIPFERRTTTVEEIADTVVFAASPRSSHTTGQLLFVDGGYVHLDRACTQPTSHLKQS
ncbi:MAG: SDR family oxidoreductase [Opitutales bacterium]|nr:SDR family oxidoreductase [Opitutales bacterium]